MNKLITLILLTLVLVSCGTDDNHFKIEGHLLNLNQGEFYVYSTDGVFDGIDTIFVRAGRFTYDKKCSQTGTLVIIFPNFSEVPIFCQPGKKVSMKGDASHLKEIEIKGTEENKKMSRFRELTINFSPLEVKHQAELFVEDNPKSIVAQYLIDKYFLQAQIPDYKKAAVLLQKVASANPEDIKTQKKLAEIKLLQNCQVGSKLPKFSCTDIEGKKLTNKDFSSGLAIIYVWASWNFESTRLQREVQRKGYDDSSIKLLGISLEASKKETKKIVERDNINTAIVCDEQMFDGNLAKTFGFSSIPQNIVVKNGKIIGRNYTHEEILKLLPKTENK